MDVNRYLIKGALRIGGAPLCHWEFRWSDGTGEPWLDFNARTGVFHAWDGLEQLEPDDPLTLEMAAMIPKDELARAIAAAMRRADSEA